MKTASMELLALYLPEHLNVKTVQLALGSEIHKRLEGTWYLRRDDTIVVYTQFNVLAMVNMPPPRAHGPAAGTGDRHLGVRYEASGLSGLQTLHRSAASAALSDSCADRQEVMDRQR